MLLDPVATTSGTYKDVTGIPNDAVYVAVTLTGISANVNAKQFRIHLGIASGFSGQPNSANPIINNAQGQGTGLDKLIVLRRIAGNRWRFWSDNGGGIVLTGETTLTAPLERIRIDINAVANNDAFDAGEISVQYSSERGNPGGTNTDDIPEGSSNQFFTNARARNAISAATGSIVNFDQSNGEISTDQAEFIASQAEAEAGALNTKAASPLRVAQFHSEQQRTVDLTGYTRITSGTPTQGQVKVASNVITIYPKSADTGKVSGIVNAGISVEATTSAGVGLTGTISTVALASNVYTITLATPHGGTGNFTGAVALKFEGTTAHAIREATTDAANFASMLDDALAVSGNGSKSVSGNVVTIAITGGGGGGGSGITTISAATDTAFSNLQEKNLMAWRTSDSKFENIAVSDVVGISNTGTNVTLGTGLDGGALTISANIGSNALPLSTISAGGATAGNVLTVSSDGNTVSAAAVNIPDEYTLARSSGATLGGIVSGGDIDTNDGNATIKNGAVTATKIAPGVIPTVPVKASKRDVQLGTDDSEFVTPLQLAAQEASVLDDQTWTGFAYDVDGADESTLNSMGEDANIDYLFQFVTSDAISAAMDARFNRNDRVAIEHDASNKIEGRVEYADRRQVGNTARWVFEFKFRDTPTETGNLQDNDAITLRHESRLHGELKDENFMESDDISVSGGLTRTIGADGAIALSTSMNLNDLQNVSGTPTNDQSLVFDTTDNMWKPKTVSGGGGSVTFATQGTANLGTSTNTVMSPETTHGVLEHLAHVASYTGFTYATSGSDLVAGAWWINATGTQFRGRGHDAAETQRMLNQFLIDRSCILERSGVRLDFDFTDVTSVTQGSNNVVQATITNHLATPTNPTLTGTDWIIRVLPEQNKQILEHAPAGVIPGIALAGGAVGPREAQGLFQKTVCKMRAAGENINITAGASTRFSLIVGTNQSPPTAKRLWAIGDGSSNSAQFSKTTNMSLVPGTITHSTMRARDNGKYFCRMDGIGTIYCETGARHGVELGLQFRHKAMTSNTWGSWQDCKLEDITETIDGNSVTTYDVSELYGSTSVEPIQRDNASGNARFHSIFREKREGGTNVHKDVAPPFWVEFGIGEGELFPQVGRDYQFRFVFAVADVGSNSALIKTIYDYSEILVADKIQ